MRLPWYTGMGVSRTGLLVVHPLLHARLVADLITPDMGECRG